MKKIVKRNQVIIAALTLMIAVAGYINFSGKNLDLADGENDLGSQSAFAEDDDSAVYEENIQLNSDEEDIGEAVLTSAETSANYMVTAKLNREQSRSKSKENYLEIINNSSLSEEEKKAAADAYVKLTENMEKETEAENLLTAKGFPEAIVTITENTVDVTINTASITDEQKAQIEDVIVNSTGCTVDKIVINLVTSESQ